jgi:alcohol dehydrogenase, propanol-preferring
MLLNKTCDLQQENNPLRLSDVPLPIPKTGELLIKVFVCGICHTELDEIEGRTPPAQFPAILGHQIVGNRTPSQINENQ